MKGQWGDYCNTKTCNFKPAFFRHKLNNRFYCMACAKAINKSCNTELCKIERNNPK